LYFQGGTSKKEEGDRRKKNLNFTLKQICDIENNPDPLIGIIKRNKKHKLIRKKP